MASHSAMTLANILIITGKKSHELNIVFPNMTSQSFQTDLQSHHNIS